MKGKNMDKEKLLSELSNQIYDTLMDNDNEETHPTFDVANVGECMIDNENNRIYFTYILDGKEYEYGIEIYSRSTK
jgi:hypothetical protein